MSNLIYIGSVGKSVGLKGYLKINIEKFDKNFLLDYDRIFIKTNKGFTEKIIENLRQDKPNVVKLDSINSRSECEELKGYSVYITREDLQLEEGEFFLDDIIGFKVFSEKKERGIILDVDNYGASDILKIQYEDNKEVMLPLLDHVVKDINFDEKRVYVNNIDDYI